MDAIVNAATGMTLRARSWSSTTVVVSHSVASTPTTINAG
jgi:hypothetical protein